MIEVPDLPAIELRDRLERGESLVLLDVREPAERQFAAIRHPAAIDVAIPMGEIPARLSSILPHADTPVVVYCHHGVRSRLVAAWLLRRGFGDVANLAGGIDSWSVEVDPGVRRYG